MAINYSLVALCIAIIVAMYMICSLNSAIILTKCMKIDDITGLGSKNPGATNMTRVYGKKLGALTFILDFAKMAVPLAFIQANISSWLKRLWPEYNRYIEINFDLDYNITHSICLLAMIAGLIGHILPIFHRFRGGKGVAVCFGGFAIISLPIFFAASAVWYGYFLKTKTSGIASIMSFSFIIIWGIVNFVRNGMYYELLYSFSGIIVLLSHRSNISRWYADRKFKSTAEN